MELLLDELEQLELLDDPDELELLDELDGMVTLKMINIDLLLLSMQILS